MRFYLGSHVPTWLARDGMPPLMVSRNRLPKGAPRWRATGSWVMDSGGFTELQRHGRWTLEPAQYARDVLRYAEQIGGLDWAAPQDWMCEPVVIHGGWFKGVRFAGTGLTVAEHQARTVGNYLDLMALGAPVIPVLQGYSLADYERCANLYERAGVDLPALETVGLGSVCRRESTAEIGAVVGAMHARGIKCHGFGCKAGAMARYGDLLASADSMAWSYAGRRRGTCAGRSRCANHLHYAMTWRADVLGARRSAITQLAFAFAEPSTINE